MIEFPEWIGPFKLAGLQERLDADRAVVAFDLRYHTAIGEEILESREETLEALHADAGRRDEILRRMLDAAMSRVPPERVADPTHGGRCRPC